MKYDDPDLLDRLAAAYVFGTLGSLARRRFRRLVRASDAAAAALHRWQAHAASLAAVVPPVQPSPHVWAQIELRTGVIPRRAAARARGWAWLRPAMGFAVGLLLAVSVVRLQPEWVLPTAPSAPTGLPASYVGVLVDASARPVALASSLRHGRELSVKFLRPLDAPPGKAAVLWALPRQGAPFRLASLDAQAKQRVIMAGTSETVLGQVAELAVSFESADAERPSGDYVLRGHCVKLW